MPTNRPHERGQAAVETVALAPAVVLVALLGWQCVLAAWTAVSVEGAARAGARAVLSREEPRDAALAALPGSMRPARVDVGDHSVRVRARVPAVVPGLSVDLSASAAVVAP
jgi:pilus assembly protein CpaE